ncbi:MAG TPA: alpha-L-arabinofuranosidase C-terminal domain-containing protein, partial [Pseudomonadales bacterium]|nr:alpha-L-arabinofuranosidase C-terminal domain-containing protein [Pseudomonadales bacterium]
KNLFVSAARDENAGEVILKIVNPGDGAQNVQINLPGAKSVSQEATEFVLSGTPDDENSMEQPGRIVPVKSKIDNAASEFSCNFPPHSFTVLRIAAK